MEFKWIFLFPRYGNLQEIIPVYFLVAGRDLLTSFSSMGVGYKKRLKETMALNL